MLSGLFCTHYPFAELYGDVGLTRKAAVQGRPAAALPAGPCRAAVLRVELAARPAPTLPTLGVMQMHVLQPVSWPYSAV